ncbi:MAG: hypothetical protein IKL12_00650 [Alistipes sp.]|nr:hypothetical protein [Alistipes sp.]
MISSASGMCEASLSNWVWGDIVGGDAVGLVPSFFIADGGKICFQEKYFYICFAIVCILAALASERTLYRPASGNRTKE